MLKNCQLVITDSGGMQKEAYFFGKYCLTLRDETEWVELIEHGFNFLVGINQKKILSSYHDFISRPFPNVHNLYGDGMASHKIAGILKALFETN